MASIDNIKDIAARLKRGPSDLVGVDITDSAVNVVRMKRGNDGQASVVAADILPALSSSKAGEAAAGHGPFVLPAKLKAHYASIAVTGESAVVKLLSFPGRFDEAAEGKVVENMGLESPDNYRISYKLVNEGHGKEARVLAVALPEPDAIAAIGLFPTGLPAPFSLEIAGISTMSAFLHACGEQHKDEAVGLVDFGGKITSFGLFNKNSLALIRRFPVGTGAVLGKVQETLGVDMETAQGIVSDGSFDISQSISEVMEPLIKQMIVSRDFVERRENCQLAKLYVSGSLVVSRDLIDEIRTSVGVDVSPWNPLQGLTLGEGVIPANFVGQEWRFAAAAGACLATFEET